MARILEMLHPPEPRRERDPEPVVPLRTGPPAVDEALDDDNGVPFIEVGGPVTKSQIKTARSLASSPTIIPLPRALHAEPPRVAPSDELALFHISFQPLPFPDRADGPPEGRFARELVAYHQPQHETSEQYRRLLSDIEAQVGADAGKVLLFTSALAGAGTTSVLLNVALTRARQDTGKVVVVDANLERPAVAQRLGAAPAPGLREVLARTVPLAWGLQETGQANLTVLTAGALAGATTMDLWPLVLDQLRHRFDLVLIDAAECHRPEWPALAGTATATYLVLRQADLEKPELNDLLTEVPRLGGRLRGYVLTQR
jgi:Mrp family chromosome partitioning ATPase